MKTLHLEFDGNGNECSAVVHLDGIRDAWTAHATVAGHPLISSVHINFRFGEFLMPMFVSEEERRFFEPLLDQIADVAQEVLPAMFDDVLEA